MDRYQAQPTGNKFVDLAGRFRLSSRWFAFALVVGVIATLRQVNEIRGSNGPQFILAAFGLLVTLLAGRHDRRGYRGALLGVR